MKKMIPAYLFVLLLLFTSGCQLFQSSSGGSASAAIQAVLTPTNIAKASQDSIALATTMFLANNPSYSGEVTAVADVLTGLAASNPSALTSADIQAALAKTSLSTKTQGQIGATIIAAFGIFQTDFTANLPTLKPQYSLFLVAAANGLNVATGKAAMPLPAVTPAPAS